ncbi:esterase family protein [Gordonia amicalis]|nr:alpha/beta hydrolase family protein [Gordonia amicalis]UOG20825.1 esterase family protein [Gordonia amicalis]
MASQTTALIAILAAALTAFAGLAQAGGANAAPTRSTIERVVAEGPHSHGVYVYSAAMQKTVKVQVVTPEASAGPRPSLYLLGGLGEENPEKSIWTLKTDVAGFYADKNVNVVMPIAGNGSLYTDWQRDDPVLGRYKWETFLTRELPPLIDERFDGNGARGLAGLSMGAGAALVLAVRNPGFYDTVAAYSGCFTTTGPAGQAYPRGIVTAFGGNPDNMWGAAVRPRLGRARRSLAGRRSERHRGLRLHRDRTAWQVRRSRLSWQRRSDRSSGRGWCDRARRAVVYAAAAGPTRTVEDSRHHPICRSRHALVAVLGGPAAPVLAHDCPRIGFVTVRGSFTDG